MDSCLYGCILAVFRDISNKNNLKRMNLVTDMEVKDMDCFLFTP